MADSSTSLGAGAPAVASHGAGEEHHPKLQHHFYSMEQQFEASILGMWVFLCTEILFFGGLFMAYLVYRTWYPHAWVEGSHELNIPLGALNTLVLICSSLTMAMSVRSAQIGWRRGLLTNLVLTILLGTTFLVVKYFEYAEKFEHHHVPGPHFEGSPQVQIFFSLYFMMTGVHAAHMVVGIGLMLTILIMAWRGKFTPSWYTPVEVSGLYWHFVDIVWIFLFPLLYLLGLHGGGGT